jgi:hypothetical protein
MNSEQLIEKVLFLPALALNLAWFAIGFLVGAAFEGFNAGWDKADEK